eukprot:jgi/Psemu1/26981/gm1.26981_g
MIASSSDSIQYAYINNYIIIQVIHSPFSNFILSINPKNGTDNFLTWTNTISLTDEFLSSTKPDRSAETLPQFIITPMITTTPDPRNQESGIGHTLLTQTKSTQEANLSNNLIPIALTTPDQLCVENQLPSPPQTGYVQKRDTCKTFIIPMSIDPSITIFCSKETPKQALDFTNEQTWNICFYNGKVLYEDGLCCHACTAINFSLMNFLLLLGTISSNDKQSILHKVMAFFCQDAKNPDLLHHVANNAPISMEGLSLQTIILGSLPDYYTNPPLETTLIPSPMPHRDALLTCQTRTNQERRAPCFKMRLVTPTR